MFLGDGKQDVAPLQRKLSSLDIKELSPHPSDSSPLEQGSHHKDRVFINEKHDRDILSSLLTESIPLKAFCKGKQFKSKNSNLLLNIVKRLSQDHDKLPKAYEKFFLELTKNSPVCGLLQTNTKEALNYLRKYCKKEINIRDCQHLKVINLL